MKPKSTIHLFDSRFRIFGTMDGFSLVKWTVKAENISHVDVSFRLSFNFWDQHGNTINAASKWQWFLSTYSQKQHAPMDRGKRYLLQSGMAKEISGVVKLKAPEASRFAGIAFHVDLIRQAQ